MSNLRSKPNSKPSGAGSISSTLFQLQVVVLVGIVLATLFTALPPAGLANSGLAGKPPSASLPAAGTQSAAQPAATERARQAIGIVAGHWGNDSGAVCPDGLTELDTNLNIATLVQQKLTALNFEVDLLKEFDPKLSDYKALALISIHADSCDYINDLATGFKVSAAQVSFQPEKAARLTACLRTRYAQRTNLPFHTGSITADMSDYHAFAEINSETTAAIIEAGFLNLDRQILTQQPDLIAQGIVDGLICYIYNEDISTAPQP